MFYFYRYIPPTRKQNLLARQFLMSLLRMKQSKKIEVEGLEVALENRWQAKRARNPRGPGSWDAWSSKRKPVEQD